MKFKHLALSLLTFSLGLTSCNLDTDEDNNYITGEYYVCNHISPADGAAFASSGTYTLTFYTAAEKLSVNTGNLNMGTSNLNFTTTQMPYSLAMDQGESGFIFNGSGSSTGATVSNLSGYTSTYLNAPNLILNDYPYYQYAPLVMQYTVNHDYTVKTFPGDAIYNGRTTVQSVMSQTPFVNDDPLYRIIFSENMKKADIIIMNARFAENMRDPIHAILLKGLDVTYTKTGYSLDAAETIIPEMYESGWTPMESRPFTSFHLNTSSEDLTNVTSTYTVEMYGVNFVCTFNGMYTEKIGQPK